MENKQFVLISNMLFYVCVVQTAILILVIATLPTVGESPKTHLEQEKEILKPVIMETEPEVPKKIPSVDSDTPIDAQKISVADIDAISKDWLEDSGDSELTEYVKRLMENKEGSLTDVSIETLETILRYAEPNDRDFLNTFGLKFQRISLCEQAILCYQKAVDFNSINAMVNLAILYYYGDIVPQDLLKANTYLKKAADLDNPHANFLLGCMYGQGEGITLDRAKAFQCFLKAAYLGHIGAEHMVGICYQNGVGIEQNLPEAIKWYQKAADQGHEDAKQRLNEFKEH